MRSAVLVCASFLLSVPVAEAADNGFYLGGGITRTSLDTSDDFVEDAPDFDLDDDENGFKIIAGFRPLDWFGAEINYVDFGEVEGGGPLNDAFELTGIDAFAMGYLSAPFVDVFAKVGAIRWDADASVGGIDVSESGTDFAWGAGVQARLGSLGGRLEYERFEVDGTDEVAMLSLSVTWTFL